MTTALSDLLFHQPLKPQQEYNAGKAVRSISGGTMSSYRRPSATSNASSYSTGRPLSTLEDSGNPNNREIYQRSASQQNLERQQSDVTTLSNHSSSGEAYEEVVIEEKRKRLSGEGFTLHRYTLGRLLGKGGFAKVYLCTAMDTGKNYAAKVVPKANLVKARAKQKLQAEIKIHRNLKHRYVCQYKHYFEDKENCYILLELCHNQSLNEMIKRRKRLTEPEAAFFMTQLLEATRYMHDQNVIHRDLKLGNLFLDKHMNVKVGDLGLATRVEDKDEKRKTICGTPNYIAPEIIQGDKAKRGHSFEVDIWSMGVILYTVLIGKPPYEAKDVKSTYQRILNNEYSFPRHIEISPYAKSLIQSMLQSKPSDRPTLDEIEAHPFLADNQVPAYLPTSTLAIAPTWRLNEHGNVVCDNANHKDVSMNKMPSLPRSSSRSGQPFAARDPNHNPKLHSSSRGRAPSKETPAVNVERVIKSAVNAMSSCTPQTNVTSVPSCFQVYDESEAKETDWHDEIPPLATRTTSSHDQELYRQQQSAAAATLTEDKLIKQTRALTIDTKPSFRSVAQSVVSSASSAVAATDFEVLQKLAEHLDTVIAVTESRKGTYRTMPVRPLSPRRGPTVWVTRYVDYTSKYGLGFLLNDSSSGVYFNDSTKTAMEVDGETFQYIDRKKGDDKLRAETAVDTYSLDNFPETLKKKVTLLKHFRNYLLQQQQGDDAHEEMQHQLKQRREFNSPRGVGLVYVKKWVRTKHAILFFLSSRTVQIIFYDQTEILLTPDVAFLTYVDKQRSRITYSFTDELVGCSPEIAKRLAYTKEILHSLLSKS